MSEVRVSLPLEQAEALLDVLGDASEAADLFKDTARFGYKTEEFLSKREGVAVAAGMVAQRARAMQYFLSLMIEAAKNASK